MSPPLAADDSDLPQDTGDDAQSSAPENSSDADALLMLEAGRGSDAAFATLVQRHQEPLLNFFTRMGASEESEDLVQETFARLYRYRKSYKPSSRFRALLYHVARTVLADHGRKTARTGRLADALDREMRVHDQAEQPQDPGAAMDVNAALERLSPKLREVIVLNIQQGLRNQEIADVLNIPLGTVKSRINLALTALKKLLDEH